MNREITTEETWVTTTEPWPMLEYIAKHQLGSRRKFRLFCVACCRKASPLIEDERSRHALEVVELWVDGKLGDGDLKAARSSAFAAVRAELSSSAYSVATAIGNCCHESDLLARDYVMRELRMISEPAAQAASLRCIFGNPFRPVVVDKAWLTGSVKAIAQAVYEERRFADLPILADALEEACCTIQDILSHCRNGEEHVRGCWAVDCLRDKEQESAEFRKRFAKWFIHFWVSKSNKVEGFLDQDDHVGESPSGGPEEIKGPYPSEEAALKELQAMRRES